MTDDELGTLVQPAQVHRRLYTDAAIFELEMQRLWRRHWLFAGHESQLPEAGDFITLNLAGQPLLMVRQSDGGIALLHNRCAHKGAQLTVEPSGHVERMLRCPYHGWAYKLDGSLLAQPLKADYEGSGFESCPAASGLAPYGEVAVHRGFIFARSAAGAGGPSFAEWAGAEMLAALDLVVDRSPQGRLRVAGGMLRTLVPANWKIYLENVNDAVHPVSTHQSVSDAAQKVWGEQTRAFALNLARTDEQARAQADARARGQAGARLEAQGVAPEPPLAMRQLLPFGSGYDFFRAMGARALLRGHSILGTQHSIHNTYASLPGYAESLAAAHGDARAREVLGFVPQNVVFYPNVALKGAPQVLRVICPLAVDKTLVEAWAFEAVGAPAALLESALTYIRITFSPASIVAHDDLHLFECVQRGLGSEGHEWVSLHRGAGVRASAAGDLSGTDEALLRNQYQAWAAGMRPV